MISIVGMVNGNNPEDMRCVGCVDFSNMGRVIYSGEELNCTYCGDKWNRRVEHAERAACEPCARVGYHEYAVGSYITDHGTHEPMCDGCAKNSRGEAEEHTMIDECGSEWNVNTAGDILSLTSEMSGVRVLVTYVGPEAWNYYIRDDREEGESGKASEDYPRRLGYVMNTALETAEEWADSLREDDYVDGWDDHGYEDEHPYSEPYDSDLWNEC